MLPKQYLIDVCAHKSWWLCINFIFGCYIVACLRKCVYTVYAYLNFLCNLFVYMVHGGKIEKKRKRLICPYILISLLRITEYILYLFTGVLCSSVTSLWLALSSLRLCHHLSSLYLWVPLMAHAGFGRGGASADARCLLRTPQPARHGRRGLQPAWALPTLVSPIRPLLSWCWLWIGSWGQEGGAWRCGRLCVWARWARCDFHIRS
jgi:hypothetical protein